MAEIKTKENNASVKKFLDNIKDKEKKKDCLELVKIMKEVSGHKPKMWGNSLIGFGNHRQKYASGREVDWLLIGFSPRKDSISLYLTCDLDRLGGLEKLGKHQRGVGCLYIKKLSDVEVKFLKKLIVKAVKLIGGGKSKNGTK